MRVCLAFLYSQRGPLVGLIDPEHPHPHMQRNMMRLHRARMVCSINERQRIPAARSCDGDDDGDELTLLPSNHHVGLHQQELVQDFTDFTR